MPNYSKPGDPYWAGCRRVIDKEVLPIAKRYGVPITSRKRTTALNGNNASDHNVWNKTADAVDLGTFSGASLARAIAKKLDNSNWSPGSYAMWNIKRGGATFRVQILWAVQGHFDHVHVGLKLVSGTYRERRPLVKPGQTARYKDKGSGVRWIKKHLRKHGYWPRKYTTINPVFGKKTQWWVRRFQEKHMKVKPDGVVGPQTWKALRAKPQPKPRPKPKPKPTPRPKPKPVARTKGLDLSNNNGQPVDYKKIKKAGYSWVIYKCSEGEDWGDPTFNKQEVAAMRAAGLKVGVYHFLRPKPGRTGAKEMRYFWKRARAMGYGKKGDIAPVIDIEVTALGKADTYRYLKSAVDELKKLSGTTPVIYTGRWFWDPKVTTQGSAWGCPLWLAAYVKDPSRYIPESWNTWTIWQYTDKARVPGVPSKGCDANIAKRLPTLR